MRDKTPRQLALQRWGALTSERSSWLTHWQELTSYLLPRNGRYFPSDANNGGRKHNSIYDNTGTRSLRTLAAGLMGGLTSPARPWFRLATNDPELMRYAPVRTWLNDTTRVMLDIFQKSNTYRSLHGMYEELGAFGTGASLVAEDFTNVIHHYPLTVGEYALAQNYRGEVCTLYREFQKTVGELVKEFGRDQCSLAVRNLFDQGNLDAWIPVIHAIEPREDRDMTLRDAKNMPFRSIYFEAGGDGDTLLRESGYARFPAVVPRWTVAGGDIYGNSPGMEALGDIKQLQHEQLRKAQGIDYMTKPPLQVPSSMKNRDVETLPGGISYVDAAGAQGGIRTAFDVRLDLNHLLMDIQDVRERVRGAFYADLFLMLANQVDARMTATEVAERHEEKLLMLGPVLERLHNELLDPLIEMTFTRMLESGIVPPPPPELQGQNLNVELVSMLAQAQRAVATNGIDRFVGNLGQIATFKPDVLDKFDADQWADEYADMLGVSPDLIVPDERVALVRNQRAQAQAQAQQAAQMQTMADSAAKLGTVDTGGKNAASDILNLFSGYGAAAA
jgi:hypothetical protein